MISLSYDILLSITILLAAYGNSSTLKLPAVGYSTDSRVMWEYMPQVKSAAFSGADKAWLVTLEKYGELWRTEDRGKSWNKLSGRAIGGMFCAVSFIDSQRGWAGNFEGQIWGTNNGGQSWTFLSHPQGNENHDSLTCPRQMLFVDELYGWVVGAFSIWRTEDGGKNWIRSLSMGRVENELWQPTQISFANRNVGLMSATGGIVHRTNDGGRTWQSQKLIAGSADARDVFLVNERIAWLTGFVSSTDPKSGTRLYRSDDSGESWKEVPIADDRIHIESVCFISPEEGWAVGRVSKQNGNVRSMRGTVLHTDDGGTSWQEVNIGTNEPFFDRMYFVDAANGWLFARDNVYRSQDAGKTWSIVLKLPPIKVKG